MPPQPLSFRWDREFVARIDEARGDIPRSVFVRRCVELVLNPERAAASLERGGFVVRRGSGSPSLARFKETRNGT
jgi:hypothetical protein